MQVGRLSIGGRETSMAPSVPIYRERGTIYRADTCTNLELVAKAGLVKVEALARGRYYGRRLARDALTGLCSVGFWDTKPSNQWGLDWQRNEGIELTFVETGSMTYDVQQRVLPPAAGPHDYHPALATAPCGRSADASGPFPLADPGCRSAPPQPIVAMAFLAHHDQT